MTLNSTLFTTTGNLFTNARIVTGDVKTTARSTSWRMSIPITLRPAGRSPFLGNGDSTLQDFILSNGQCSYSPIGLGDFNNDSNLDVALLLADERPDFV